MRVLSDPSLGWLSRGVAIPTAILGRLLRRVVLMRCIESRRFFEIIQKNRTTVRTAVVCQTTAREFEVGTSKKAPKSNQPSIWISKQHKVVWFGDDAAEEPAKMVESAGRISIARRETVERNRSR